jgi:hypothetical protein
LIVLDTGKKIESSSHEEEKDFQDIDKDEHFSSHSTPTKKRQQ